MRRYGDDIEVRLCAGGGDGDGGGTTQGAPEIFIWRGRLYLVRGVVDHWVERRPWWRDVFEQTRSEPTRSHPDQVGRGIEQEAAPGRTSTLTVADLEHEVWRVEAAAGSSCAAGIYDLVRAAGRTGEGDRWQLRGVSD